MKRRLFEHHAAKPREVQELLGVSGLALVDRYTKRFKLADRSVIECAPTTRFRSRAIVARAIKLT